MSCYHFCILVIKVHYEIPLQAITTSVAIEAQPCLITGSYFAQYMVLCAKMRPSGALQNLLEVYSMRR